MCVCNCWTNYTSILKSTVFPLMFNLDSRDHSWNTGSSAMRLMLYPFQCSLQGDSYHFQILCGLQLNFFSSSTWIYILVFFLSTPSPGIFIYIHLRSFIVFRKTAKGNAFRKGIIISGGIHFQTKAKLAVTTVAVLSFF